MKKRKVAMCIGLVCGFIFALAFNIGSAHGEIKADKLNKYKNFGIYVNDELVDNATSYEVEDSSTGALYFAHTEAVQVLVKGKLKYKNVVIIDSPVYWPSGEIAVLK